jgi:hypothetical protein
MNHPDSVSSGDGEKQNFIYENQSRYKLFFVPVTSRLLLDIFGV